MSKAEKRFRFSAVLAVFVLLSVLLAIINGVSFTMAGADADRLTQTIAQQNGALDSASRRKGGGLQAPPDRPQRPLDGQAAQSDAAQETPPRGMGPMGPSSPEMRDSLRYFTIAFDKNSGQARTVAFRLSAVSEEQATQWARDLQGSGAQTGWTRGTYRYRVYKDGGQTLVTVIDQGRELLPGYRILIISACGLVLCVLLSYLVLRWVGKRLFAPLEDADRKQRQFLARADREFRIPLNVIGAETELLERACGAGEQTQSIRRQVKKLSGLVAKLSGFGIFDREELQPAQVVLNDLICAALDSRAEQFAQRALAVETELAPHVALRADPEVMRRVVEELADNALTFAKSRVRFVLTQEEGRILLRAQNDTELPEGTVDQVFDRFTTLSNAGEERAGLGLAYVKQAVIAHAGRVSAAVADGMFTVQIAL